MPKEPPPSSLNVTLSVLRVIQGWPQNELAAALGCGAPLLSDYEAGRKTLSRKRLEQIVAVLGLPAEAVDRTLSFLQLIRSLSLPEGGSALGNARTEANVARVLAAAEAFARSVVALAPERRAEDERRKARDLWDRLRKASPKERRSLVKTTEDFRSWALCELVCERSLEAAADRADRALELADLAVYIAEMAPGEQAWRVRLRGYALAHLGNAKRVGGDLPAADEVFGRARKLWEAGAGAGVGFLDQALVLGLEASLRRDQRRLPEALSLLNKALMFAQGSRRIQLLINRSNVFAQSGEFEGAINTLREAVPLVLIENEPRTLCVVFFNLANNLLQIGRIEEAEALLLKLRNLGPQLHNDLDTLRLRWLEARMLANKGQREKAISILVQLRADFSSLWIAYDAALVTLELVVLYLEEGRISDIRSLGRQMLWIFQTQGVHREALAALRLFQEAAERETATAEMVRELIAYLHRARYDPELRFEAQSGPSNALPPGRAGREG
jgi:tetratricopeptide (TPR) repeat protein